MCKKTIRILRNFNKICEKKIIESVFIGGKGWVYASGSLTTSTFGDGKMRTHQSCQKSKERVWLCVCECVFVWCECVCVRYRKAIVCGLCVSELVGECVCVCVCVYVIFDVWDGEEGDCVYVFDREMESNM